MRSSRPSAERQITSSRQSPRMSAESAGVALVPLLAAHSAQRSNSVVVESFQFHFEITTPSSNSRSGSASHQIPKLMDGGLRAEISTPFAENRPPRAAQAS